MAVFFLKSGGGNVARGGRGEKTTLTKREKNGLSEEGGPVHNREKSLEFF